MADSSISDTQNYPEAQIGISDNEQLMDFICDLFKNEQAKYATFSIPVDVSDLLPFLNIEWNNDTFQYYWEKPDKNFAIAAGGELCTLNASGPNRFQEIKTAAKAIQQSTAEFADTKHPYTGLMFLGGFSFFDNITSQYWKSFRPASFTIPQWVVIKTNMVSILTLNVELKAFSKPEDLHHYLQNHFKKIEQAITSNACQEISRSDKVILDLTSFQGDSEFTQWVNAIKQAKNAIDESTFEKIVLARHLAIPKRSDTTPTRILNHLRKQYTSCYNFLIHNPSGNTFLGSTPEQLGTFKDDLLQTEALAGSIQRGATVSEDVLWESKLTDSQKDHDEHNFVVKDILERLRPVADNLDYPKQPQIKKLSNVQHLFTPIQAKLKNNATALDVIRRLHPTPAVGGYPWEDAAPYIQRFENFDRGWYAGPVGWFNAKGDAEFAVGIRSGLITKSQAHFFAGCGIVADSDPKTEWKETNLKLKPMLSALQYD